MRPCLERGCDNPYYSGGWCLKHYRRWELGKRRLRYSGGGTIKVPIDAVPVAKRKQVLASQRRFDRLLADLLAKELDSN